MEECQEEHEIIDGIADLVQRMQPAGVEPGVEMTKQLSSTIDNTVKGSIGLGCDMSLTAKGIMIGAFRANRAILLEVHKTMHLLIHEIIQSVFRYKGNVDRTIDGLLDGIATIAREHKLNEEEALAVAKENILLSADQIDREFHEAIKRRIRP